MYLIKKQISSYYAVSVDELKALNNVNFYSTDFSKTYFIRGGIPFLDLGDSQPSLKCCWSRFNNEGLILLQTEEIDI